MIKTLRRSLLSILTLHCCVLVLFFSETIHAGEYESAKWNTELCSCQAKVDIEKISPEIIVYMFEDFRAFEISKEFGWWDYRNAKVEQLKSERKRYQQEADKQIRHLINLKLPDIPALKQYHDIVVREFQLETYLYLAELDFLITGNTTELKKDFLGEKLFPKCKSWAETIESKELTYKILPEFIEQKCLNNADSKRCQESLLAKTLNDFKNAQVLILSFGWHNCVNHQFRIKNVHDYKHKALEEIDHFLKDKECECDEP